MKYIIFILLLISNFLYAEEIRNKTTIITTDGGIKVYQNEKYYDLLDNVKIDSKDFDLTANNVLAYYDADLYDLTKIIAKKDAEIITSEGAIIKINPDIIISIEKMKSIKESIQVFLKKNDSIGVPEFKEINNLTRKFAIPVLEYLDKINFTYRLGNKRKLSKDKYE